jgi:hypothetical protein
MLSQLIFLEPLPLACFYVDLRVGLHVMLIDKSIICLLPLT